MGAEDRLAELKLELPPAPNPVATYVTALGAVTCSMSPAMASSVPIAR